MNASDKNDIGWPIRPFRMRYKTIERRMLLFYGIYSGLMKPCDRLAGVLRYEKVKNSSKVNFDFDILNFKA